MRTFFFFVAFISVAQAKVKLDLNFVHNKPIDNKLILKSEWHEAIELDGKRPAIVKLKNGMEFELKANSFKSADMNGEGKKIFEIESKIYKMKSDRRTLISKVNLITLEGEKATIITEDGNGFSLDFSVRPEIFK